jgi:hypothetical protein
MALVTNNLIFIGLLSVPGVLNRLKNINLAGIIGRYAVPL